MNRDYWAKDFVDWFIETPTISELFSNYLFKGFIKNRATFEKKENIKDARAKIVII